MKEIRAITGLTQAKFARLLDVDVGTLRNWEQGPAPATALLRAIKRDPKSVLKALAALFRFSVMCPRIRRDDVHSGLSGSRQV